MVQIFLREFCVIEGEVERFGKYELLEKIAAGGMAEVFRARSRGAAGFEKIIVIKKILPKLADEKEFQTLFLDEARIAVQLVDVNIVQVFDLGEIDGQYFMAMEFVDGVDLSKLIQRTRKRGLFPIPLALFIISEVLKALHFAHHRNGPDGKGLNIVHCDISPQNILISNSGEVKLTDFGISRAAFQMQEQHQVIRGKYAYMAPEQVAGKALTGQTDIFALSIVLFELLAGKRLFKAKEKAQTLNNVRNAIVPSLQNIRPEVSDNLEQVVFKGLAKERSKRFQSSLKVLEALSSVLVEENHRATNNDLAQFLRDLDSEIPLANSMIKGQDPNSILPQTIVVVSMEIVRPPRVLATPRLSTLELLKSWSNIIEKNKGAIWERNDGSILAVWVAKDSLESTCRKAVQTALSVRKQARLADYRASIGIAPGVARVGTGNHPPNADWHLAGPFYLARWMMNLSAHRGKILMTEVVSKTLKESPIPLGRIHVQANSSICLYEK